MFEKLFDLLKANWLNPKFSPIGLFLLALIYISTITSISAWDNIDLTSNFYIIFALILLSIWVIYFIICLVVNRLPKAKKNGHTVLFVIDAESQELFDTAKYKLVGYFNSFIVSDDTDNLISALCISRKKISKYNFCYKQDILQLLIRTNCMFLVSVRYSADSITNAENFELKIDYTVRHPQFDKTAETLLSHDLTALTHPLSRQKFNKAQTIDIFNLTTHSLAFACQYILGFVHLLAKDNDKAYLVLSEVHHHISNSQYDTSEFELLRKLIKDRLYVALANIAISYIQLFARDKEIKHLQDMCVILDEANQIRPDTYFYCINMAYAYIILKQDLHLAKECIDKCKQSKQHQEWRYSEAFLSAYSGHAPGSIITKYKRALKVPYKNLIEIVEYIEYVLEHEPNRTELHLAAGLVYEDIGDIFLMKQHLSLYLDKAPQLDHRLKSSITEKLSVPCDIGCDQNCCICNKQLTA